MEINKDTMFVSDTHLGHNNILKHCKSRVLNMKFKKIDNHDTWIKNNWNLVVKDDTMVVHCGDLSYKGKHDVISGLKGNKYLLKGNHDDLQNKYYDENNFKLIEQEILIKEFQNDINFLRKIKELKQFKFFKFILFEFEGLRFLVSHFPMVDTMGYDEKYRNQIDGLKWIFDYCKCDYNIHGHTHENHMKHDKCLNISFEQTNFKPIKLEDIIKKIKR